MAEALLRRRLEDAGVSGRVSSAGSYPSGNPATAEAVQVMASRGLDIEDHRSTQVAPEILRAADLVIGMTREHVREAAVLEPTALARTFTLKELVTAGTRAGARRPGETLDAWLDRVGVGRRRQALLGAGHDEEMDIADPVGLPRADYERTADELEVLLDELVALAWPAGVVDEAQGRTA